MTAKVDVRGMQVDDLRLVCHLNQQLGYSGTIDQIRARFEAIHGRDDQGLFVASVGQRLGGWLHVQAHHSLESEPYAEITGLVVDHDERRRGIGRSLVTRSSEWAKERRLATLRVRSNVQREEAHKFYPALGFRVTKTQHNYLLDLTK